MNPWDLSCRSKLGEFGARQQQQLATVAPVGPQLSGPISHVAAGSELVAKTASSCIRGVGSAGLATIASTLHQLVVPTFDAHQNSRTQTRSIVANIDHLAAYSSAVLNSDGGSFQSTSSYSSSITSSQSSSLSKHGSSLSSSWAHSPLATSPASTRSNSIEISEEIQLVQRVVMFNEQAAAAAAVAAKEGLLGSIDQLNNTDETIISNSSNNNNNNNNTDTSSRSSSTGSNSSSNGGGGGSIIGGPPPSQDRKARKKDQNRRAAYNYRRKKMEEKNRMREEEMRLVYSRVCLIGYAEKLEGSIMCILQTKTTKILDKDGNSICFLCPICLQSCDNILNLRSHLNVTHNANSSNNDNIKN